MKFRIVQIPKLDNMFDVERYIFGLWFSVNSRTYFRAEIDAEDYIRARLAKVYKKKEKKKVIREYDKNDLLIDTLKGLKN